MHRQVAADAVAGAVIEVHAPLPQGFPREGVEMRAGRSLREARRRNSDVPLQDQGEALAHLLRWRSDRDRPGDVGGAILVLSAGVDEEQLAGSELAVGGGRHTI